MVEPTESHVDRVRDFLHSMPRPRPLLLAGQGGRPADLPPTACSIRLKDGRQVNEALRPAAERGPADAASAGSGSVFRGTNTRNAHANLQPTAQPPAATGSALPPAAPRTREGSATDRGAAPSYVSHSHHPLRPSLLYEPEPQPEPLPICATTPATPIATSYASPLASSTSAPTSRRPSLPAMSPVPEEQDADDEKDMGDADSEAEACGTRFSAQLGRNRDSMASMRSRSVPARRRGPPPSPVDVTLIAEARRAEQRRLEALAVRPGLPPAAPPLLQRYQDELQARRQKKQAELEEQLHRTSQERAAQTQRRRAREALAATSAAVAERGDAACMGSATAAMGSATAASVHILATDPNAIATASHGSQPRAVEHDGSSADVLAFRIADTNTCAPGGRTPPGDHARVDAPGSDGHDIGCRPATIDASVRVGRRGGHDTSHEEADARDVTSRILYPASLEGPHLARYVQPPPLFPTEWALVHALRASRRELKATLRPASEAMAAADARIGQLREQCAFQLAVSPGSESFSGGLRPSRRSGGIGGRVINAAALPHLPDFPAPHFLAGGVGLKRSHHHQNLPSIQASAAEASAAVATHRRRTAASWDGTAFKWSLLHALLRKYRAKRVILALALNAGAIATRRRLVSELTYTPNRTLLTIVFAALCSALHTPRAQREVVEAAALAAARRHLASSLHRWRSRRSANAIALRTKSRAHCVTATRRRVLYRWGGAAMGRRGALHLRRAAEAVATATLEGRVIRAWMRVARRRAALRRLLHCGLDAGGGVDFSEAGDATDRRGRRCLPRALVAFALTDTGAPASKSSFSTGAEQIEGEAAFIDHSWDRLDDVGGLVRPFDIRTTTLLRRRRGGAHTLREEVATLMAAATQMCHGFSGLTLLRRRPPLGAARAPAFPPPRLSVTGYLVGGHAEGAANTGDDLDDLARLADRRRSLMTWHVWVLSAATRQLLLRLDALAQLGGLRRGVRTLSSAVRRAVRQELLANRHYKATLTARCYRHWDFIVRGWLGWASERLHGLRRRRALLRAFGTLHREAFRRRRRAKRVTDVAAALGANICRRQMRAWRLVAARQALCRRRGEMVAAICGGRLAAAVWQRWWQRYQCLRALRRVVDLTLPFWEYVERVGPQGMNHDRLLRMLSSWRRLPQVNRLERCQAARAHSAELLFRTRLESRVIFAWRSLARASAQGRRLTLTSRRRVVRSALKAWRERASKQAETRKRFGIDSAGPRRAIRRMRTSATVVRCFVQESLASVIRAWRRVVTASVRAAHFSHRIKGLRRAIHNWRFVTETKKNQLVGQRLSMLVHKRSTLRRMARAIRLAEARLEVVRAATCAGIRAVLRRAATIWSREHLLAWSAQPEHVRKFMILSGWRRLVAQSRTAVTLTKQFERASLRPGATISWQLRQRDRRGSRRAGSPSSSRHTEIDAPCEAPDHLTDPEISRFHTGPEALRRPDTDATRAFPSVLVGGGALYVDGPEAGRMYPNETNLCAGLGTEARIGTARSKKFGLRRSKSADWRAFSCRGRGGVGDYPEPAIERLLGRFEQLQGRLPWAHAQADDDALAAVDRSAGVRLLSRASLPEDDMPSDGDARHREAECTGSCNSLNARPSTRPALGFSCASTARHVGHSGTGRRAASAPPRTRMAHRIQSVHPDAAAARAYAEAVLAGRFATLPPSRYCYGARKSRHTESSDVALDRAKFQDARACCSTPPASGTTRGSSASVAALSTFCRDPRTTPSFSLQACHDSPDAGATGGLSATNFAINADHAELLAGNDIADAKGNMGTSNYVEERSQDRSRLKASPVQRDMSAWASDGDGLRREHKLGDLRPHDQSQQSHSARGGRSDCTNVASIRALPAKEGGRRTALIGAGSNRAWAATTRRDNRSHRPPVKLLRPIALSDGAVAVPPPPAGWRQLRLPDGVPLYTPTVESNILRRRAPKLMDSATSAPRVGQLHDLARANSRSFAAAPSVGFQPHQAFLHSKSKAAATQLAESTPLARPVLTTSAVVASPLNVSHCAAATTDERQAEPHSHSEGRAVQVASRAPGSRSFLRTMHQQVQDGVSAPSLTPLRHGGTLDTRPGLLTIAHLLEDPRRQPRVDMQNDESFTAAEPSMQGEGAAWALAMTPHRLRRALQRWFRASKVAEIPSSA